MDEKSLSSILESHQLTLLDKIGEGGFGTVYQVFSLKYNQVFAMKIYKSNKTIPSEIGVLLHSYHSNIINLYEYFQIGDNTILVTEFCPGGDLFKFIAKHGPLNDQTLFSYSKGLLNALSFLHEKKISHNDIKPENVLIDVVQRVKLADFGNSGSIYNTASAAETATLRYMSPEMLSDDEYDHVKADIWAMGVTFFYMATGTLPFADGDTLKDDICNGNIIFELISDEKFEGIVQKMLNRDPSQRPSASELLKEPYFDQFSSLPKIKSYGRHMPRMSPSGSGFIQTFTTVQIRRHRSSFDTFHINTNKHGRV